MNWEAISAIGQIVGALAVVISLIYLAREIRGNARSARLASVDTLNRWLGELIEHPHLSELYYRGIHDFQSLQGADLVRFSSLMGQLFHIYEEIYYQHLERHLEKRLWRAVEAPMRDLNAYPGIQAWWRSRSHWFDEKFASYVNQQQQTATAPSLFRETMED